MTNKKPSPNPLRNDPSKTGLLRRKAEAAVEAKFKVLVKELKALLNEPGLFRSSRFTFNSRWSFLSSEEKVTHFENWIISKLTETMEVRDIHSGVNWWQEYINKAYEQGARRSFEQQSFGKPKDVKKGAFGQFRYSLQSPVNAERFKLIVGRTFKDLKGFNEQMRNQLSQGLIDGFLQGLSPRKIAADLGKKLALSKKRLRTIVRTEIVRAQAEGQLAALRSLGVGKVGVDVEFITTQNACPKCNRLKGKVFTLEEAQGIIPVHPDCRCSFIPHVSSVSESKKQTKSRIEQKLLASKKARR